jgi:hypothetical protein
MAEVVVTMAVNSAAEAGLLSTSLSAFAKWSEEQEGSARTDNPAFFMMRTERYGQVQRKILIFGERRDAARFLVFWRRQRRASRAFDEAKIA